MRKIFAVLVLVLICETGASVNAKCAESRTASLIDLATAKNLYIDYIKENPASNPDMASYALIYVNDDDVPELLIDYGVGFEGAVLCTVSSGKVEVVKSSHSDMFYFERKNLFHIMGGHMDNYSDRVYTIQNGEFVLLHNGRYGAEDNSKVQVDEEGNPIYQYFWNGKEVSDKDYERSLKAVFDDSKAVNAYKNTYTASEIIPKILDL
ncbi:MAG: hypothetical protein FWF87_08670 [Synergistaceae bacterium]|nr:hypothetical protein [Synergistaceae bacterium]